MMLRLPYAIMGSSFALVILCLFVCCNEGAESPVAKKVERAKKKPTCSKPKGNVGKSLYSGCNKKTCKQIKNKADWLEEFAFENCCWQSQTAYEIGDTFSSAVNPDTGINTTLRCAKSSSGPHIVVDVSSEDTAGLEITNDKIKEVKDLLLNVLNIIKPLSGTTPPTTTTTPSTTTSGAESAVAKKVAKAKQRPECSNPWGKVGNYLLSASGCKKRTCQQIKNKAGWIEEFAYENCCWQNQTPYKIGKTFSSVNNPDTGINTTLRCARSRAGTPHIVVDVSSEDKPGNLQKELEQNKKEVEDLLLAMLNIIRPGAGITLPTNSPATTTTIPSTTTTTSSTTTTTPSTTTTTPSTTTTKPSTTTTTPSTTTTTPSTTTRTPSTTTTKPSTTTKTPCPFPCASSTTTGILIAGGIGAYTSTEVFLPGSGKTCALADLPDERYRHTLDTVSNTAVLCGGYDTDTRTSCLQFNQTTGTWSSYATTLEKRDGHTSWVSPEEKLVLMGGTYSGTTTEIVNGGMNFTLVNSAKYACSIQLGSYTIITGGYNTLTDVSKYNLQGHVEDLPSLLEGRRSHACGSYQDRGDTIIVVAGGWNGTRLSTTEVHTLGSSSTTWTYGGPLPRAMSGMASVSLYQEVMIMGGYNGSQERSEILSFNGVEWTEVGQLGIARSQFAATTILVDQTVCG